MTPSNKKGPGQSINYEFDTIMHPKVEVTQVEDAASAAAASGASDKDIANGFFNSEITVMIGGILAGGFISFAVFLLVGFVCIKIRRTRPQLQQQHNQNNHCNLNGSSNGGTASRNRALLQVSLNCF